VRMSSYMREAGRPWLDSQFCDLLKQRIKSVRSLLQEIPVVLSVVQCHLDTVVDTTKQGYTLQSRREWAGRVSAATRHYIKYDHRGADQQHLYVGYVPVQPERLHAQPPQPGSSKRSVSIRRDTIFGSTATPLISAGSSRNRRAITAWAQLS